MIYERRMSPVAIYKGRLQNTKKIDWYLMQHKEVKCIFTLAMRAVEAPNLAAATHWLAPFPPFPILNSFP